jgi:membrane fusion protein, copper/silver efflux system
MKSYRKAFLALLTINLLAAAAIGGWWWHRRAEARKTASPPGAPAGEPAPPPAPATAQLVPIQLSPERLQSIGVKTGTVAFQAVHDAIRVTGNVVVDESREAYIQVRFSGWTRKVFVNQSYQFVRKGQPLFTIYSPDLLTTERDYLLARQNEQLLAASSVPGVSTGARSLLDAAVERLKQWQVPEREIARLKATGEAQEELEIDSPVSGFVIERNALPNMYVTPETRLYSVADLSTVWVYAEVFQNDLGRVRIGDPATLTVDAYPGRSFHGRVDFLYPQVDLTTRTARVRLVFANPGLFLKPGMFVNVVLELPLGRQLVIPGSGVLQSGTHQIVFVDHGQGYLEPREVELGPLVHDQYIVIRGLQAGERIVTSANFLIDSESQLQAALGSFVPPPPGAGAAAAINAPQAEIQFSSEPSPPAKGTNVFRARLTDTHGGGIAGATVEAIFFMPAMPQMGMAAMRLVFTLNDRGGGNYQGQGELPTGGTWQVTVVARRNGQTLATRQMTLTATGGM